MSDAFGHNITVPAGEPFKIKVPYKGSPAPTATFYNVSICVLIMTVPCTLREVACYNLITYIYIYIYILQCLYKCC